VRRMTDSNDAAQHPAVPLGAGARFEPAGDHETTHGQEATVGDNTTATTGTTPDPIATYGSDGTTATPTTGATTDSGDEVHNHGQRHHASLADLNEEGSVGHVFDQTNGLADGLSGDSDGTADSDTASAGERGDGFGDGEVTRP
jgi:hypothetical protein